VQLIDSVVEQSLHPEVEPWIPWMGACT